MACCTALDTWSLHFQTNSKMLLCTFASGFPLSLQEQSLNVVVRTGHTSLLLRDALRRPLLEVELGEVESGLRRLSGSVLQVGCSECSAFTDHQPDRDWAATDHLHYGVAEHVTMPTLEISVFLLLNLPFVQAQDGPCQGCLGFHYSAWSISCHLCASVFLLLTDRQSTADCRPTWASRRLPGHTTLSSLPGSRCWSPGTSS